MTKRQIIQWCHGQYAAAYYMHKKGTYTRSCLSLKERAERCDNLSELYISQTFRLGLKYQNGKIHIYPNRLNVIRQTITKNLRFTTPMISYTELVGLVETFLIDDEGVKLDQQKVNQEIRDLVIQHKGSIVIKFIFNKRKINV